MTTRICRECAHFTAINSCKHPELIDRVTGDSVDCYPQRYRDALPEDGEASCGPTGALWEPAPPQPPVSG